MNEPETAPPTPPPPSDTTPGLQPDDVRHVVQLAYELLEPLSGADWAGPAGDLAWDCRATLEHLVSTLDRYSMHLATPSLEAAPRAPIRYPNHSVGDLLLIMQRRAGVLAAVVSAAAPTARGFHPWGRPDPPGYIAMACAETLIHVADISQGLGQSCVPPMALCQRVLARLFPWAPTDVDPWSALQWATNRLTLPGYGRTPPNWTWHSAPIGEWDGTIKTSG